MIALAAASSSGSTLWYVTRGTGAMALVLLSGVLVLGILNVRRYSSARIPRVVIDSVHRNMALLAVVFLIVHIVTSVIDPYAPIGWLDAVLPLHSAYRSFWLGLGALSFDLMLAIVVTSLLRARVGHRVWRAAHWLAYGCWPIAVVHAIGTGSDVNELWLQVVGVVCVVSVLAAVAVRVGHRRKSWEARAGSVSVVSE